jgi:hypothetical protein
MSKKTKVKEWEFKSKYLACPREVVESLFAGRLSVLDMKIFAVIQSLSKTEKGCYLKNASFARLCKVTECSVKRSISRLKELDLIRQIGWDGRRRFLRSTYYCEEENGENLGKISTETAGEKPMPPGHSAPMPPGHSMPMPPGHSAPDRIYYINNIKENNTKNIPARNERGCDADGNSLIGKKDERTIWEKMAGHFKNHIPGNLAKRSVVAKDARLLKSFCKREAIELPRIKKIIRWYSSQFDAEKNPYSRKYLPLYIPQAISMRGFCEKFVGIECAMLRQKEASIESKGKRKKPVLPPEQQKLLKSMQEGFCFPPTALLSTLQKIIPDLSQALSTYRQRVERMVKVEVVREMYLNSLFTEQVFFRDYANWIEGELRHWENWSGDFRVFKVGAFPFQKYLNSVIMRQGFDRTGILGNILAE